MRYKSFLFTALISCLSLPSYADTTLDAQVIYAIDTAWDEKGIKYSFEIGQKLEGCSSSNVFVENSPMSEKILNIALAAHYAKKPVKFRVKGCKAGSMNGIAISLGD